jgi:NAD(P)-dependent dehydrogenase (short-subunit alcohol dehydrogenase family)
MLWKGPKKLEGMRENIRLASRLGKYEDVAGTSDLLASEQLNYAAGFTLFVHDGFC